MRAAVFAAPSGDRRVWGLAVAAVVGLWAVSHPYLGVVHDARIYVLQALREIAPDRFAGELIFQFGAQDEYSLFTWLLAPAVDAIGISMAAMVLTALGHGFWLAGAIVLVRRLLPEVASAATALVCLAAMPNFYGGLGVFGFAEGFLTPRLFAEAATLWAFWLLIGGRPIAAVAAIVAGAVLHPLYGLIGLGAIWVWAVLRDWRWLGLAPLGIAVALAAAFRGIAPFDGLLTVYDPAWLDVVRIRSPMLFIGEWTAHDWSRVAFSAALVAAAASIEAGQFRRFALTVLGVGLGGIAATGIGADLLDNQLIIQLQFYRADWLLAVFGHLGFGVLLAALFKQQTNAPVLAAALVVGVVAVWVFTWQGLPVALVALWLAVGQLRHGWRSFPDSVTGCGIGAASIAAVIFLIARVANLDVEMTEMQADGQHWTDAFTPHGLAEMLAFAALALLAVALAARGPRPAIACVVLVASLASIAAWDRRPEYRQIVEAGAAPPDLLAQIPEDASVFYEGFSGRVWFLLGRKSYVGRLHGAPATFWRPLALEFKRRADALAPLETPNLPGFGVKLSTASLVYPPIAAADIFQACKRAPELDVMLLRRRVDGVYTGRWTLWPDQSGADAAATSGTIAAPNVVYLYDCGALRRTTALAGKMEEAAR